MGPKTYKKPPFRFGKNIAFFLMALPGLLWFFLLCYLPMYGIILAFKDFRFSRGGFFESLYNSKWVGLQNFYFLFTTDAAWVITRNTLLYNITFIVLGTVCAIAIAIALSEVLNKRLAKVFQTLMFMPYFLSIIVVGYVLMSFLSIDKGTINQLLLYFHCKPVDWYGNPGYWPYILVTTYLWKNIGYTSVFYLAGILAIDKQYYEAAMLDGASKWSQIWHITLPHLKPLIIVLVLVGVGQIFRADFGTFYWLPLNTGALFPTTNVIDTYIFRGLMVSGDIGMTVATGLYQSLVGMLLIFTVNKTIKRFDSENAMF